MERLVKHSRPSSQVTAAEGTIWEAHVETTELYIQTSKNEAAPNWRRLGVFLEKAFDKKLHDKDFIEDALELYHQSERVE